MTAQPVDTRCKSLIQSARDALDWVADPENKDMIGVSQKDVTRNLRRVLRRSTKLERALGRNTSVSVFGPSQAGKSFLVSVLARPMDGRLVADFGAGAHALDYISEINPEGEGESTGLVTRFTMDRPNTPDGYPVKLSLLSESDIIRILSNSFYFDGDQSEPIPEPSTLSSHLAKFESRKSANPVPGLELEDIWDIEEYTKKAFGKMAYANALSPFWDRAGDIAPYLTRGDRGEFFSILWGGYAEITQLYLDLSTALDSLQHADTVFSGLDALTPKETSIIDVKTLHRLYDGYDAEMVELSTGAGQKVRIGKPVLCALTAELLVPMRERPHDFLEHTDLLDFPGARTRFEQPLAVKFGSDKGISELLLRGKVAFLFDRYVADQEITSMLLCVADSNMEVDSLPGLIESWIGETLGNDANIRGLRDNILFFVLTKFDKHLSDTAASSDDHARFDRRLQASLLEKFGRGTDKWVSNWTPGQPFDNCYWLRNPNYYLEAFYDLDKDKRETPRADKAERLQHLKDGYLQSDEVRTYFKDPERAWNAAMAPNDGGVTYLVEEMTKVCKPGTKVAQIEIQMAQLTRILIGSLEQYYISDDFEKRREKKEEEVQHIIGDLEDALENGRFSSVIASLSVNQDDVRLAISEAPNDVRLRSGGTAEAAVAAPKPTTRMRPGRAAPVAAEKPPSDTGEPTMRSLTNAQFQAEWSVRHWLENLTEFRDRRAGDLGVDPDNAQNLKSELEVALRRTRIMDDMVSMLEKMNFGHTLEEQAPLAAMICSEEINRFVNYLAYDKMADGERPRVDLPDGSSRAIFTAGPDNDAFDLPAVPRATADDQWTDWVFGLHDLVMKNAMSSEGADINHVQNGRLAEILAMANTASERENVA